MAYYFDKKNDVESNEKKIKVKIKDKYYEFYTDNNVFSKNYLDFGTRTLLESIESVSGDILDFGCGYGPIGIYLKSTFDCNVDMVDINDRALNLSKKNSILNDVDVNIFESDIYNNIDKKYDYIITNPPIRVGKVILYKILFEAQQYLKASGHLIFVIHKDQGAKSLMKLLNSEYKVSNIKKNKGFFVIDCQKP